MGSRDTSEEPRRTNPTNARPSAKRRRRFSPSAESPSTSTIWASKNSAKKSPNSGPTCMPSKKRNTIRNKESTDKNTTSTNSAKESASTWANSPRTRGPSRSGPQWAPPNPPSAKPLFNSSYFSSFFANLFLVTLHTSPPPFLLYFQLYYFCYVIMLRCEPRGWLPSTCHQEERCCNQATPVAVVVCFSVLCVTS